MTTNHVNRELSTGMAANPIPPSDAEKQAVAESHAAIQKHYDGVDRRAAILKEDARSHVDDDVKTFSPEVIARLIHKSATKSPDEESR
jgi:hypothetical protein